MIQHVWSVLCSKALEDKRSHNVSLIEAIVGIGITVPSEVPDNLPIRTDFTLANLWYNDGKTKETAVVRSVFVQPSGKEAASVDYSIEIEPHKFNKFFTHIGDMPLTGPGTYQIVIRVKGEGDERWKRVASLPLKVTFKIDKNAVLGEVPEEVEQ